MNGKDQKYQKYQINNLDYIESLTRRKKVIAYLNSTKDLYIDLTSNTILSDHNIRQYSVEKTEFIDKFINILNKEGLGILLLNSYGKIETELTMDRCLQLLNVYQKTISIDENIMEKIDEISLEVSNLCTGILQVPTANINIFKALLREYVRADLIIYGLGMHNASIVKVNEGLDYKVLRIFKLLGIEVELKLIPNFKIEYNKEQIKLIVNDFPQMNQVKYIDNESKVLVNTIK